MPIEGYEVAVLDEPIKVYNFEVEGFHTYYVSGQKVLVHNSYKKETGSYTINYASGKKYHGKGTRSRMRSSERRLSKGGDAVVGISDWSPASTHKRAFMQEAFRMAKDGGKGGNNYNKINSPGLKYLKQLKVVRGNKLKSWRSN